MDVHSASGESPEDDFGPAASERDHVLYRSPDVLVYTMGKVGSTSISTTLRAAGVRCFDIHHLDSFRLGKVMGRHFDNPDRSIIPPNLIESLAARNMLLRRRAAGEVTRIITCFREPVARNISAVYQNLPQRLAGQPAQVAERVAQYNVNNPDEWFESDFIPTTGLFLFNMHVDRTRGFFRFANRLFDVLALKIETPDDVKSQAISDFMGVKLTLQRANDSRDKWYSAMYAAQVNAAAAIPGDFAKRCFALKYYRAFYSDEEIANAAKRYGISL